LKPLITLVSLILAFKKKLKKQEVCIRNAFRVCECRFSPGGNATSLFESKHLLTIVRQYIEAVFYNFKKLLCQEIIQEKLIFLNGLEIASVYLQGFEGF
jgi:hypothetical protein